MKWKPFERVSPIPDSNAVVQQAQIIQFKETGSELFLNNLYQVRRSIVKPEGNWAEVVHLSIKRVDKYPIHDWRHLQRIKNELAGPDYLAVEVYPPEEFLVDTANQYHLWCTREVNIPWMFHERLVSETPVGNAINRPFDRDNKPADLLTAQDLLDLLKRYK